MNHPKTGDEELERLALLEISAKKDQKIMKFTYERPEVNFKAELEIHNDSTCIETVDAFRKFLLMIGFHEDTIKEAFGEENEAKK